MWWVYLFCIILTLASSVCICKVIFPIEEEVRSKSVRTSDAVKITKENNTGDTIKVMMYNKSLDSCKEVHEGFSFTVLFFGFFPALFRSDWKWAAIMFLCSCFFWFPAAIFFAFKYNELYMKDLYNKGYKKI